MGDHGRSNAGNQTKPLSASLRRVSAREVLFGPNMHVWKIWFVTWMIVASASNADAQIDDHQACTCNQHAAACDAGCACDDECSVDWDVDECTLPGAGCLPESADATLEADEDAAAVPDDPIDWAVDAAAVSCPDGAVLDGGRCMPGDLDAVDLGGCATTAAPGAIVGLAVVLLIAIAIRRRRQSLVVLALAASCATDAAADWDELANDGPTPSAVARIDVFSAARSDGIGARFVLAHQPLAADTGQPTAQFALERTGDVPILRADADACGDRLTATPGDGTELLGWARSDDGDGTAAFVELIAPDGCRVYETSPETIETLTGDGYTVAGTLGYVWPPGLGDPEPADAPALYAATCHVTKHSPWFLLYASPGADETEQFLGGCPGEVIVGEKRESGPHGRMKNPANHERGGRTAFVLDRNGDKLRELLARPNGVERTAAYLRAKLASGYDYIVVDEITAAADWADGHALNHRFRKLLLRLPPRTVIGYVSIDLTQYAGGAQRLRDRRYLMRALKRRGRGIALEVYLHTAQVMAGAAPSTLRTAAARLARSTRGMKYGGGINLRAISVLGTSMHSIYPQYRYLDQPSHDLAAIRREVNAIRHGSKRLRQQHGVGYYFVNKSDMAPPSAYSYAQLIARMHHQTLRFR